METTLTLIAGLMPWLAFIYYVKRGRKTNFIIILIFATYIAAFLAAALIRLMNMLSLVK